MRGRSSCGCSFARWPAARWSVDRAAELHGLFASLQQMIESARDRGEVRADVDAVLAAWIVYGSLEEILTGWVLGQLPSSEGDVERAVATVVDVAHAGLAA